jgi:hypothetical protein
MTALSRIEHVILEILANHPDEAVSARELLSNRGFRRSAPAFVFTMMNLADKGLIECREEVIVISGGQVRDRYYRIVEGD